MAKDQIRDYRDLHVWQKAIDLAVACDEICEFFRALHPLWQPNPARREFSAFEYCLGNGRFSRADYLKHLSIANGSLRELESHLYFAQRRYGSTTSIDSALRLCVIVAKLLGGLVRSLRRKKPA